MARRYPDEVREYKLHRENVKAIDIQKKIAVLKMKKKMKKLMDLDYPTSPLASDFEDYLSDNWYLHLTLSSVHHYYANNELERDINFSN